MEKNNFTTKLHLVSKMDDHLERGYRFIYFRSGYAYVTNGVVVLKQSLDYHSAYNMQNLEGKRIYAKAYAEILKFSNVYVMEDAIHCFIKGMKGYEVRFQFENSTDFSFDLPKEAEKLFKKYEGDSSESIVIDPVQLSAIQNAFYTRGILGIKISFGQPLTTALITHKSFPDQKALIMPIITRDPDENKGLSNKK